MSRQSTLERELLQVWKALHEVSPTDARRFLESLDLFRSGLTLDTYRLEEHNLRGRSLEQRHAALDARAVVERMVRDLNAVALHAEAKAQEARPAPEAKKAAKPPEGPKAEVAKPPAASPAEPAPGSAIGLRRVVDAIFEEGPAPVRHRRPGPASPMHGHAARTAAQLELGMPVVRELPARGGTGQ